MSSESQNSLFYDAIIIGAGAAGLMCAITAAERGKRVLVLERSNKPGKKILMSGGGRCNFTNLDIQPENYISKNPHFCKSALNQFTQWDFIAWVEQCGIPYHEKKLGQLFCDRSAKDILGMLLNKCQVLGVEIKCGQEIKKVECLQDDQYAVSTNSSDISCLALVIASGGLSIPTLGGSGVAYELAQQFNLPLLERRAGLVPFMFTDGFLDLCKTLSGVSIEVSVSSNGQSFTEDLLFTHRGLSGPAILQISSYWQAGDEIEIDLAPGEDLEDYFLSAKSNSPKALLKNNLPSAFSKTLIKALQTLFWPQYAEKPLAEISDNDLKNIAANLHAWKLKPSATEGYRTAEVTLGGIDTDSFSSKTMACKTQKGLYAIGEALDVTGHLGGYNFQWAWSSGYCAGINL